MSCSGYGEGYDRIFGDRKRGPTLCSCAEPAPEYWREHVGGQPVITRGRCLACGGALTPPTVPSTS